MLCANKVNTSSPACTEVTCAGFYGDVQKEVPHLASGKDFSRLEWSFGDCNCKVIKQCLKERSLARSSIDFAPLVIVKLL